MFDYLQQSGAKRKKFNEYNYFRSHLFPLYDEVTEIIGGSTAKGIFAFSSTSSEPPEMQSEGNDVNEGEEAEPGSEGPEVFDVSQGSDTPMVHTVVLIFLSTS